MVTSAHTGAVLEVPVARSPSAVGAEQWTSAPAYAGYAGARR
jgi:hypothetical protein